MEKKRSFGVTIFSWIYIVGGILSALSVLTGKGSYTFWSKAMPLSLWIGYMAVTFLLGVSGLIGGIGALKLIAWARKVIIIVAISNLIEITITVAFMPKIIQNLGIKQTPLFLTMFIILIPVLFFFITIYFLTRPKAKKQFK